MSNETIFEIVGRLFFTRERIKRLGQELSSAGIDLPADSFAGYAALNVIVVTIVLTLALVLYPPASGFIGGLLKTFTGYPQLLPLVALVLSLIAVYASTLMLISTYLLMKAEDRRNKLESVLPDFLTLVASNIKAGMTLDQAMWYSAKPEFGLLSQDVKAVIKGSFSGQSLESALDKLGSRFDSRVFKRTILLLKQATSTGGELTKVLERTSDDARNTLTVRKEIAASLVIYEIFVLIAAVVGTPFLFAVAGKLIGVFEKITPQFGGSLGGGISPLIPFASVKVGAMAVTSQDFFWFSIPTIFVTTLISSFIVSVIRTGNRNQGMKYFPFVLAAAYLCYWIVNVVIEAFFATLV